MGSFTQLRGRAATCDSGDIVLKRDLLKFPRCRLLAVTGCKGTRQSYVVAPESIAPGTLSPNAAALCELARDCLDQSGRKAIFINDIAHYLIAGERSWHACGVDWKTAVAELRAKRTSVTDTYAFAAQSSAAVVDVCSPGGIRTATTAERAEF